MRARYPITRERVRKIRKRRDSLQVSERAVKRRSRFSEPTVKNERRSPNRRSRICATIFFVPQTIAPDTIEDIQDDTQSDLERVWLVIVWNDPVNLMSYVTFVLQKLFGYSRDKATKLMLQVHHQGRAVVSSGSREKAELDCFRLHGHGLWATLSKSD
nr:ATP-dependent Clp protease adapter ClpS [Actinomycetota bacterium]